MPPSLYTHAIVRQPGINFREGNSTQEWEKPDYRLALRQHALLCQALEAQGIRVLKMEADVSHPDCPFVEDTAVVAGGKALLMHMSTGARATEVESIGALLSRFVEVRALAGSAAVEGGDVVAAGQRYFIGVTRRTSQTGAEKLAAELAGLGFQPQVVPLPGKQFLRSHLSWLGGGRVLCRDWVAEHPAFGGLEHIVPLPDEAAGANAICLGNQVLLPEGCPYLAETLEGLGYGVSHVPVSEFQKMDGSLSSLVLLW